MKRIRAPMLFGASLILISFMLAACGDLSIDSAERLARARDARAAGDFAAAIVDLKAFLQQMPENAEARVMLGEALLRTSDFAGSDKEFERALELIEAHTSDGDAAINVVENGESELLFRVRLGLTFSRLALRDFAGAQNSVAELISQRREDLGVRWLAAQVAFSAKEDEAAREHLELILSERPDHAGSNFMLGLVNLRQSRPYEAESYLDTALNLEPENDAARIAVTQLKGILDKPVEALEALIPMLEKALEDPRVLQLFESLDLGAEDVSAQVLSISERLRDVSPESVVPYILRARVLFLQRRFREAASVYDAAVERGGGRYAVVGSWLAYNRSGDSAAARRVISEWLMSNPDDSALRAVLASGYIGSGEFDSAAAEYEFLVEQQGRGAILLNNLAWLYGELGDERAVALAREAYRLAPRNAAIIDTLGWLLVQKGEYEEGIELLRQAVATNPDIGEIHYHLAQALAEVGADDEANRILAETAASGSQIDREFSVDPP